MYALTRMQCIGVHVYLWVYASMRVYGSQIDITFLLPLSTLVFERRVLTDRGVY